MGRKFLGCGFACAIALSAPLMAQNPPAQNPPTQAPPAQISAAQEAPAPAGLVTIEGCVVKEADAPGRTPPPEMRATAERDNDFLLTDTKVVTGSAPAPQAAARSVDTPVGTSGAGASPMYEIEGLDKAQLTEHKGRRVQIQGTFDHIDRASNPVSYANDLVELRATSIKPIEGACSEDKK